MRFTRKAGAQWKGSGRDGSGTLTTPSKVLNKTPYSFHTRFEDEPGTNPEELVGAAHAGCFAMQLSFLLGEAGFTPDVLDVDAKVTFEDGRISHIKLYLKGKVPGIESDQFTKIATKAKQICPISKLLNAEIELAVTLR